MGLYNNRLAELSEAAERSRRLGRSAGTMRPSRPPPGRFAPPAPRRTSASVARPSTPPRTFEPSFARGSVGEHRYSVDEAKRKRPAMSVQSLLFSRADGWTVSKAKQWAKSNGYKYGSVDVTDQYIRLRQFDPKGLRVKRTKTFGRGIKAVVAREEPSMATTKEASRRRRRPSRKAKETAKEAPRRRRRTRRTREAAPQAVAAPRRRRRARRTREAAPQAVAAPRRRRRRSHRASGQMMEAPRRRRRRSHRSREAWHGNPAGHRKAAKKGWTKRRRSHRARETSVVREAPRRRRRSHRRTRETAYAAEAPRRRRRRSHRRTHEEAPRRRRRSTRRSHRRAHAYESPRRYSRSRRRSNPFSGAELAIALGTGALGFIVADGLDRFLATYDPTAATKPTDKFTSDGAGTLANTLNVAATPSLIRAGAAVAVAALPLVGSMFVDQPYVRSSMEGFGIGAGISAFRLLWNNVLMPLLKPSDTSVAGLQKSFIARLYPAELAASINMAAAPTAGQPAAVSSGGGSGALSGAADVGPFALSAESPYPDAAQALRRAAGISGPGGNFPSVQNVWGTGADFPTAAQAMGVGEIVADITKTVSATVPGVHPATAAAAAGAAATRPHDITGALVMVMPHVPMHVLMQCAQHIAPHVARLHAAAAGTPVAVVPPAPAVPTTGTHGAYGVAQAAPPATGAPMATPLTAVPTAPIPMGPPPLPVPGPRMNSPEHAPQGCACLSDDNPFLGFIGDAEEDTLFTSSSRAA